MPIETRSAKRASAETASARSIEQWGQSHGISRSRVYELINEGIIVARKLGGRTLIFNADNECFRERLPIVPCKATAQQ